jgi:hypothetical protein
MGIRGFIAALVGAAIGMTQFICVAFFDAAQGGFLPKGDFAYFVFSLTWLAEMFALIVIAMYRIAPWIARLLGDEWEASRIRKDKQSHVALIEWVSMAAILGRAIIRTIDSGHLTTAVVVGGAFAIVPLIIPRPSTKKKA